MHSIAASATSVASNSTGIHSMRKSPGSLEGNHLMENKLTIDGRLAIEGGSPVRTRPFPPWPVFDHREIEVVAQVLRSGKVNYWTGRQGRLFEEEFAERVGCRYAVAVATLRQ
jgi:hypothetical protein